MDAGCYQGLVNDIYGSNGRNARKGCRWDFRNDFRLFFSKFFDQWQEVFQKDFDVDRSSLPLLDHHLLCCRAL